MYEAFYKFSEKPFTILPDPDFLYLTTKHKRALSMLEYGVMNQAGFSVITGDIGSGKTTLVRRLMRQLGNNVTVGLVSNAQHSAFEELMRWILFAFSLEYRGKDKVEMFETFTDHVISEYAQHRRILLIIDEAQNLGEDALEELRMLSNINMDKHQVLQLILVGQPDLWHILRQPELRQFAQRIAVDYRLEPLDQEETRNYIRHRLTVAKGDERLFDDDAYPIIWKATGGVPRLINLLCDAALVYGFADQRSTIGVDIIRDVLADKQNGISPLGEGGDTTNAQEPLRVMGNAGDSAGDSAGEMKSQLANQNKNVNQVIHSESINSVDDAGTGTNVESKKRKLSTIEKLNLMLSGDK